MKQYFSAPDLSARCRSGACAPRPFAAAYRVRAVLCILLLCLCAASARADAPGAGALFFLGELTGYKGKVVVVNFFATWCAPCREEVPGLARLRLRYPPDKLVILGISLDEDVQTLPDFLRETGVNYPVKTTGFEVARMFNVRSLPHNAVYDVEGRLAVNTPGFASEEEFVELVEMLLKRAALPERAP